MKERWCCFNVEVENLPRLKFKYCKAGCDVVFTLVQPHHARISELIGSWKGDLLDKIRPEEVHSQNIQSGNHLS